ncbi:ABC-type amino acid transport substrate-binding protein [Inhella inkyongensis]|uniref:ABC-type amino acid transport substrate-binding protein n=1 Tax=Inhella inkyongensis TaxID=392593 RepID=A0A840S5N2_9BURK|nr:transporter substrate-binding domain-containing protein [Inhella inkyongensis]MBB5203810.1 ABC-type amino acid transport substrate-binding protein [Inhella inkyongensis]
MKPWALALLLAACTGAAAATAPPLRMVAPTNLTEPIARFERGELVGGVLKDLGDTLARRLGRTPLYVSLPGKRVSDAMQAGAADLVCYVLPGWIDGDYLWSQPILPNAEVVATRPEAPPIKKLADLEGRRVGTISGYRYSHLLSSPGAALPFERFDAPDTRANLAKLAAARMPYAIVEELALRHFMQQRPEADLRLGLVISRYTAPCALSRQSTVTLESVNQALGQIVREGEMQRILRRYGG